MRYSRLPQSLTRLIRHVSSRPQPVLVDTHADNDLVKILLRNPELDLSSAKDELRWIKQDIKDGSALSDIASLCERRARGEPLQYVLGTTDFGPLILKTRAPTLIPRPETAHITTLLAQRILASRSLKHKSSTGGLRIADLCTGSGCIALLLALHLGHHADSITGYDISTDAIALAEENAKYVEADNSVDFKIGDIWQDGMMEGKVDVLVSNPPYIPLREWKDLPASVKAYEDPRALIGDPADLPLELETGRSDGMGLAFYRKIAEMLPHVLEEESMVEWKGCQGMPRDAKGCCGGRTGSSAGREGYLRWYQGGFCKENRSLGRSVWSGEDGGGVW